MGTKTHPGKFDCYAAAKPDEPMFVLLARDRLAAPLVQMWSHLRDHNPEGAAVSFALAMEEMRQKQAEKQDKVSEALRLADAIHAYRQGQPYCRVCLCTEAAPCYLDSGDPCTWTNEAKIICDNPECVAAAEGHAFVEIACEIRQELENGSILISNGTRAAWLDRSIIDNLQNVQVGNGILRLPRDIAEQKGLL